jgi:hypothetical protein
MTYTIVAGLSFFSNKTDKVIVILYSINKCIHCLKRNNYSATVEWECSCTFVLSRWYLLQTNYCRFSFYNDNTVNIWAHKSSLTPPLLIEMPVQIQESQRFFPFLLFRYLILELPRQCGTFCFLFYL